MRFVAVICFTLLLVTNVAVADTRAERLATLMEAEGVSAAFDAAREMVRQQTKADADKGMASLLTHLDASQQVMDQLHQAYSEFIDEVTKGAFRREDMVASWSDAYGANFSDDELTQLLAFYQSPLGIKTVAAARSSMPKVMEKMQAELQPRLRPAIKRYTEQVGKVIADCKCERKSAEAAAQGEEVPAK